MKVDLFEKRRVRLADALQALDFAEKALDEAVKVQQAAQENHKVAMTAWAEALVDTLTGAEKEALSHAIDSE